MVQARCERRDACSNGIANKERFGDLATCENRDKLACLAGLAATGTGATPTSVATCAAAIPGASCTSLLDNAPPAACTPAPGSGANGAPCVFASQCQSGFCSIGANAACGTCAAAPKPGATCAATSDCATGQVCAAAKCVVAAPAGSACTREGDCESGLSCVGATKLKAGVCQAAGDKVGASCDPQRVTAPSCDRNLGLYCETTTHQCAAVTFVAVGQPCGRLTSGLVACLGGATCKLGAGSQSGVCEAPAADGAACNAASGPSCLAPARCVVTGNGTAGTCRLPDASACK